MTSDYDPSKFVNTFLDKRLVHCAPYSLKAFMFLNALKLKPMEWSFWWDRLSAAHRDGWCVSTCEEEDIIECLKQHTSYHIVSLLRVSKHSFVINLACWCFQECMMLMSLQFKKTKQGYTIKRQLRCTKVEGLQLLVKASEWLPGPWTEMTKIFY